VFYYVVMVIICRPSSYQMRQVKLIDIIIFSLHFELVDRWQYHST